MTYLPHGHSGMPPAASTPEGVADQLHKMLTSDEPKYFPNPIDCAIKKYQMRQPFIESKSVLAVLKSDVGKTPERFLSNVLKKLKHKDTIKYVHLYPSCTKEGDCPFDFSKFSEQLAAHLPKWEFLQVMHMYITNFRIESTTLKNLILVAPNLKDDEWEIKCPNLVELEMQNIVPPVNKFQRALINCPRIETYFSHKYWNEQPLPALYLPNCTKFTFRRGDSTESLKLYLPRVKELNLDGCFGLKRVELLTQGHADHAEWNKDPGAKLSKFRLSRANASLSARALNSLRDTGRITNPSALEESDSDDEGGNPMDGMLKRMRQQMAQMR